MRVQVRAAELVLGGRRACGGGRPLLCAASAVYFDAFDFGRCGGRAWVGGLRAAVFRRGETNRTLDMY